MIVRFHRAFFCIVPKPRLAKAFGCRIRHSLREWEGDNLCEKFALLATHNGRCATALGALRK